MDAHNQQVFDLLAVKRFNATVKTIENQSYEAERSLYGLRDTELRNVRFEGKLDGESPLKECSNYKAVDCFFNLRYPCWHADGAYFRNCRFLENSRAPFWYDKDTTIESCQFNVVKAFRECDGTTIIDSAAASDEFGWKCRNTRIEGLRLEGVYAFFENANLSIRNMEFKGKYSFQYNENLSVSDSRLDTKDAFWHAKGGVIRNSYIKGEYLAWYSDGLTFVDCTIEGTQPFVNCTNLKLVNCRMLNTDLAFENCDVEADITTPIISVKNPRSGYISAPEIKEVIFDGFAMEPRAEIRIGK